VENHENYHAERSQSRDFKQVPAQDKARNMKNCNTKMGGSVEQKETQPVEVRFLGKFSGCYKCQIIHEIQISHRNAPCIVDEMEEHNCTVSQQTKFSVA
jgi:hypothetical protein